MNYQNLINQGLLKQDKISFDQVNRILERSYRNIKSAKTLLDDNDEEGAFRFAYDAMLAAGRALVFSYGLRPRTIGSHKIVVDFTKKILGGLYENLINIFDKARKKRHYLIYGLSGSISETEAKNAIENAQELIKKSNRKFKPKIHKKNYLINKLKKSEILSDL